MWDEKRWATRGFFGDGEQAGEALVADFVGGGG